jgi:hypothetical protein
MGNFVFAFYDDVFFVRGVVHLFARGFVGLDTDGIGSDVPVFDFREVDGGEAAAVDFPQ